MYQRAFEAVVWSMPAMIKYGMRRASLEIGAGDNVICAWSAGAKPLLETLTPNNTSPYVTSTTDLRKGPVVLEVPKATDKAILFGQIADDWFVTIADIGPIGLDKGKGNKILPLPPGYTGEAPAGYAVVKSPSYSWTSPFAPYRCPRARRKTPTRCPRASRCTTSRNCQTRSRRDSWTRSTRSGRPCRVTMSAGLRISTRSSMPGRSASVTKS